MGKRINWKPTFNSINHRIRNILFRHKRRIIVGVTLLGYLAVCITIGTLYIESQTIQVVDVFIGEKRIGTVKEEGVIQKWVNSQYSDLKKQFPDIQMTLNEQELLFQPKEEFKASYNNEQAIAALEKELKPKAVGVEVLIDGKSMGFLKNQDTANYVLDRIKKKYIPKPTDRVTVLSSNNGADGVIGKPSLDEIEFVQQVSLNEAQTDPSEFVDPNSLLESLQTGNVEPIKYTVQEGDCISCIAEKFNISQELIFKNNPWIENDFLNIGDELDLTVLQPMLSVKTVEHVVETLDVPHGIIYEEDNTMRAGTSKVIKQGFDGIKEVTYQITKINGLLMNEQAIAENWIAKPVDEIVKQGTKVIPGIGTGSFAWPVIDAKLTSKFGKRWGRLHAGTDSVSDNRNILASDNGKVEHSGWKSGYGNTVIIDHQNGYKTLYAHMKSLKVDKGDTVAKGDKIGIMGTTGNSTGVHLHFEIRKDDVQQNPLKYLN